MAGNAPEYDAFISYRVATDSEEAQLLYELLTSCNLKVWWDKKCLKPGEPWREGFCAGLVNSRAFLALISKSGINSSTVPYRNFGNLRQDSQCDNVFLEHRLALELRELGYLEKVFPVMIGEKDPNRSDSYLKFFSPPDGGAPWPEVGDTHVDAVEAELQYHMDGQALGSPMIPNRTVASVLNGLRELQGGFIDGNRDVALKLVADTIVTMLSTSSCADLEDTTPSSPNGKSTLSHNTSKTIMATSSTGGGLGAVDKTESQHITGVAGDETISQLRHENNILNDEIRHLKQQLQQCPGGTPTNNQSKSQIATRSPGRSNAAALSTTPIASPNIEILGTGLDRGMPRKSPLLVLESQINALSERLKRKEEEILKLLKSKQREATT